MSVRINNQQFELITTFSLFDNYLHNQTSLDLTSASNNLIYEPIRNEIIDNAEAPFMFETIRMPYQPGELLKKEVATLRSSPLLNIAQNALSLITPNLPGPSTKIIFMPANPAMHDFFSKHGMCMNAITIGTGKIVVMIDPTLDGWQETLPYVIAHEYHHSAWISKHWTNADFSVLEYLIFEGRADAFATALYKTVKSPWTTMINREQEIAVWKDIKAEILLRGHDRINKVMFGNSDIPLGSGYTIGFNIVRSFKENNPDLSDNRIIDLEPEEILKMSKYK